jgi:hypothetical protein
MRKEISLETQAILNEIYRKHKQKKRGEGFEKWFKGLSTEELEALLNCQYNFAKIIENEHNLENFTTEQLIMELKKRTDMMFVGNFYDKEQIMELCGANEMEAKDFMEDCNPREDDAVLENADIELQGLFENWQDENEQIIND